MIATNHTLFWESDFRNFKERFHTSMLEFLELLKYVVVVPIIIKIEMYCFSSECLKNIMGTKTGYLFSLMQLDG